MRKGPEVQKGEEEFEMRIKGEIVKILQTFAQRKYNMLVYLVQYRLSISQSCTDVWGIQSYLDMFRRETLLVFCRLSDSVQKGLQKGKKNRNEKEP